MFQIKIGTFSFPELHKAWERTQQMTNTNKKHGGAKQNMFVNMPRKSFMTGRIIVDLSSNGEHDGDSDYPNTIQVSSLCSYTRSLVTLLSS
jgi:hypothetical protein